MFFFVLFIFKFVLSVFTIRIKIAFLCITDNSLSCIFALCNNLEYIEVWFRNLHIRNAGLNLNHFLNIIFKWNLLVSKSHFRSLEIPRSGRFGFNISQIGAWGKATFIIRTKLDTWSSCFIEVNINWKHTMLNLTWLFGIL